MSNLEEKINQAESQWRPSATVSNLLARAKIIDRIRQFFRERGMLEVSTPILSEFSVTDIHLRSFATEFSPPQGEPKKYFLITSPEYHMKRLLCAGSGPIFQLGKVFRNEEEGAKHSPEFTMLEWYRPFFDMHRLINEVDDLLQLILETKPVESFTYEFIFQKYVALDPLSASTEQLIKKVQECNLVDAENCGRDELLEFLFSTLVEVEIGKDCPTVVYNFPASQAALAQINSEDRRVADRFEVYYKGLELANGFCELTDYQEQKARFEKNNEERLANNLPPCHIDYRFLAGLKSGMPSCSGVALGLDRLLMLALGAKDIREIISFDIKRA